jgi:hypothetical protein
VLGDQAFEQRVAAKPALETGGADDLRSAVHRRAHAETPFPACPLERLVPPAPRWVRGRRVAQEERRSLGRRGLVVGGQSTPREQLTPKVERSTLRLAPPNGDHRGARVEGVQPFRRGRHPRADNLDLLFVGMRLVGVDRARVAG